MPVALITGISGQDGPYLARFLLEKGYEVYGTGRDAQTMRLDNLMRLGIADKVKILSLGLHDFSSIYQNLAEVKPDEVYNLAGQSSVSLSFQQPVATLESIANGSLNFLEAIRLTGRPIKFYNAGSSECFGDTGTEAATEQTALRPRSPYAVAKAAAFWQVANYREAYGLHASTGILFNHESPLRPERFVTRKIISAAVRIGRGSKERLSLGNIDIARDWGWAPDYVEAMWLMLQQSTADDFVIATGMTHKLSQLIDMAFREVGLNWQDHVDIDRQFFRPTDLMIGKADPSKAQRRLGWKATHMMPDVVAKMIAVERGLRNVRDV